MKSSPKCVKCAVKIHENGAFLVERIYFIVFGLDFTKKCRKNSKNNIFINSNKNNNKNIIKIIKIIIKFLLKSRTFLSNIRIFEHKTCRTFDCRTFDNVEHLTCRT